ncbi:uncharacterized protein JCM10292_006450 [Rhodotorula paludigena]|uniref:uncharacterized protein n=1 Tax=Rhodotorula paludigena TaxID=86838 RepID=UPI0031807BC1
MVTLATQSQPTRAPRRRRRAAPPPEPTNTLIVVVPPRLNPLLPLFHAHFATYGTLHAWTPLERFGRVVAVYDDPLECTRAKAEMDGFVWEDEHERGEEAPQPLRVYYGPTFPLDRLAYLPRASTSSAPASPAAAPPLLEVPSSGKNFLISPPGSPPVGWEQIEEEAPNTQVWHQDDEPGDVDFEELKKAGGGADEKWADELARALRFLSVDSGGGVDDDEDADGNGLAEELEVEQQLDGSVSTTQLVLPPAPLPALGIPAVDSFGAGSMHYRPAVTVSSPPRTPHDDSPASPISTGATPPPGASKITSVKATIDSMFGSSTAGAARITPTSRPPLASDTPSSFLA